jgi:hypothetical protein
MGTMPIFNLPHVWDIMKEINNVFNPNELSPEIPLTSMNIGMKVSTLVNLL